MTLINQDLSKPLTCPLCGTNLIPRYEFLCMNGLGLDTRLVVRYICPDCIPPEAN